MTTDRARELLTEVATGIADRFAPCGPIQVDVEPVIQHPGQYRLTLTVTIDDSAPAEPTP